MWRRAEVGRTAILVVVVLCLVASSSDDEGTGASSPTTSTPGVVLLGPAEGPDESPDALLASYFAGLSSGDAELAQQALCRPMTSPDRVLESYAEDHLERGLAYQLGSATPGAGVGEVEFTMSSDDGPIQLVAIVQRDATDGGICLQEIVTPTS